MPSLGSGSDHDLDIHDQIIEAITPDRCMVKEIFGVIFVIATTETIENLLVHILKEKQKKVVTARQGPYASPVSIS